MPAFITNSRGVMVTVDGPKRLGPSPFSVRLQAANINGLTGTAIVTQAMIREDANVQFMHTLDESIFVYVFGDKIAEARIGGICFSAGCNGNDESGMQQILRLYRELRVSRNPAPALMLYDNIAYKVFLTGVDVDVTDADRNIGQWALRFKAVDGT